MNDRTEHPLLGPRFLKALEYAASHHQYQLRKGTKTPYVAHLLQVAGLVLDAGGGEDAAIAALLHDAIEDALPGDAPRVRAEIQSQFGQRVLHIVEQLSDADVQPKPPWRKRKEAYLEHLQNERDADVLLISCADKLHNARTIARDVQSLGPDVWSRFKGGEDGTLWYYRTLLETYRSIGNIPLFGDFEVAVADLEKLRHRE